MAAYVIANVEVTDVEGFKEYQKGVPATLEAYGGRYLARGGNAETLEGDWQPHRLVVIEFPSMEQARRWYTSDEYAPLKDLRLKTANTRVMLVQGI